ncbi:MAG: amidohydrolase family protein [Verrucomicrobiota bacterium]|jgi:imidazolonepropionase-like amidohydrolase
MRGYLSIAGALVAGLLFPGPASAQPSVAVTHVTVIDGTGAKPKADQTVLVAGERIVAVGTSHRIKLPADLRVIDGTGKFLIPGLWDMHVHMSEVPHFSELCIANGVTGVRDMFGDMTNIVAERKAVAGGKPGPRIVAAGRLIDGPKPIWPGSITAKDAEEGRAAVLTAKQEGSDFIKVYSLLPRDAYFAIAAEAKRQGMVFAGHVPDAVSAAEASDAGQKSIEHLTGILLACSTREAEFRRVGTAKLYETNLANYLETLTQTYDEKKAQALFARFKRNHTWQCPTLTVLDNISHLDDGNLTNDYRMRYMDAEMLKYWGPQTNPSITNTPPETWAVIHRTDRVRRELVGKMHRVGVEFLAGTDTPNPYCFPGFSLHDELARLVEAGLTPMEVLQTATLNPARYFDRSKDLGTVQQGKYADLVLLDADPLQDIHNTTKIRAVFANGRFYDRAALDQFLHNAEQAVQPPSQKN